MDHSFGVPRVPWLRPGGPQLSPSWQLQGVLGPQCPDPRLRLDKLEKKSSPHVNLRPVAYVEKETAGSCPAGAPPLSLEP
jgi:hypothetical protein